MAFLIKKYHSFVIPVRICSRSTIKPEASNVASEVAKSVDYSENKNCLLLSNQFSSSAYDDDDNVHNIC